MCVCVGVRWCGARFTFSVLRGCGVCLCSVTASLRSILTHPHPRPHTIPAGSCLTSSHTVAVLLFTITLGAFISPLRRKYDGVKYALKRLQDILYELSLTGKGVSHDAEQPSKRLKTSGTDDEKEKEKAAVKEEGDGMTMIVAAEFDVIRETMETYDKRREAVIKSTRDVQKLSKQAIYSLQRNSIDKAKAQIAEAVTKSKVIFEEHIMSEPQLRQGSYSNAMEEFAEAVLFLVWLEDKRICALDAPEFEGLIDSIEYLGACNCLPSLPRACS